MSPRGVRPGLLAAVLLGIVVVAGVAMVALLRPTAAPLTDGAAPVFSAEKPPVLEGRFPAEGEPRLRNPLGIAVSGDRVYVAESDAGVVRVFAADGSDVASLAIPVAPGAPTAYPADVAVLSAGRLAVLDVAGARVVVIDPKGGRLLATVPSADETAPLRQPTALSAEGGDLYVADAGDRTVKVYADDGSLERVLGASLRPSLTFVGGMAVAGERLWVSDSNAGRVVALDRVSGAQASVLPTSFSLPRGVAAGPRGSVFVVDAFSHAVTCFDASLTASFKLPADTGSRPRVTPSPRGVACDPKAGRVFVTDAAAGLVRVYR